MADAFEGRDVLRHDIRERFVLADPNDGDQILVAGDRVDLGDARDIG